MSGILSGTRIWACVLSGEIDIDPFVPEHINPASVDLTLGSTVRQYVDTKQPTDPLLQPIQYVHDVKIEHPLVVANEIPVGGFVLWPGHLYLMHTVERVHTKKFVPVLDGKSSIGRLGVQVHLTAGFGDPGFDGQYTLEVVTFRAVRLYAGMRICQMRFHALDGDAVDYTQTGSYVGLSAQGPVASHVHKQFKA